MAQGTFKLFNMFTNYVRSNIVNLDTGTWSVILCSDNVSNLTASEVNPARGSTNINEVTSGGGYTSGGVDITLANTSASSVFTFAAELSAHPDGIFTWSKSSGSPTNIKTAVLIDKGASSPTDAALGFWDMTTDGGTTALDLTGVDINLVTSGNSGKIFTWTVNN
jgi:hypothetical protein